MWMFLIELESSDMKKHIKQLWITTAAFLIASGAHAAIPVFVATCPGDINVDSGKTGVVYINSKKANVKKINNNFYEAKSGVITISVSANGDKAPDVSYSGKGRANGICQVTGFEAATPAAAAAAASTIAAEPSSSERAGQGKFDASGKIPCAQKKGQPMGQCEYKVARGSNGSATVVVTRPDGRTRAIFFEKGKAVSADLSQADGNMKFRSKKKSDLFMIEAGNERYEIPEAVVFGG
jgi:hypothetical protein